ncbi:MAG: helix-turn-helix domain-containing protein [Bacteroidota bacterium]
MAAEHLKGDLRNTPAIPLRSISKELKWSLQKKQLESDRKTGNEIIYEVGYNDIDAFRRVFKKHTDLSPVDYRKEA